jgi:cation transport ATPase
VHEKKETHVHKPYPDSRNLTEEECKVETLRIQAAHEEAMAEIEYRRWLEDENRKERREREEQLRKERERKAEENKKSNKKLAIFAGAFCAGLLGLTAYGIYTDSRRPSTRRLAFLPAQNVTTPISTEGSVE